MKKNILFFFIYLSLCLVTHNDLFAQRKGLLGSRHFSISYGNTSQNDQSQISVGKFELNLPLTRKLDLGFGTIQNWGNSTVNTISYTQRNHQFFTNLKYHFLPASVIDPFLMIELGHLSSSLKPTENESNTTIESTTLVFGNTISQESSHSQFDFYYSASIGEEFRFANGFLFSAQYTLGNVENYSFQIISGGLGYKLLRNFFSELVITNHINQSLTNIGLAGNLIF